MELALSHEEADLIHRILSSFLSDLRMEVADTDNPSMRRTLKGEEEVVRSLVTRIEATRTA